MASRLGRAFTLAEVMLALGLATVILLSLVSLSAVALQSTQKGSDALAAEECAHAVLERFVYGLEGAGPSFWTQTSYASPYATDDVQVGSTTYSSKLNIAPVSGVNGLLKVQVQVSWWAGEKGRTGYGQLTREAVRFVARP